MLTKAARLNSKGIHEAAKQLLIWAFVRKHKFHKSCANSNYDSYNLKQGFRRSTKWGIDQNLLEKKVNFNIENLKECKKNFYQPHPDALNRSAEEIEEFHKKHDIQIFGKGRDKCPTPIFSFEELNLPERIQSLLRELKYSKPTPVQSQAWPLAMSGLNMVGISRTGSGKTLGFMLPALLHIQNQPPLEYEEGPIVLVIAPTRELTRQTAAIADALAARACLRSACIYGGNSKNVQRNALHGAHICIATPGRLMDFLNEETINLKRCTYCVLDEADRLLDMGFEPQIRAVMSQTRPDIQTTMWSATWPREVRNLAETFLKDYVGVKFGSIDMAANPNIKQQIHFCKEGEKRNMLISTVREILQEKDNKTLIFTRTKDSAEYVSNLLQKNGISVAYIHGDVTQARRDYIIRGFKTGRLKFLVGTSVVSRGLDITDIRFVINYDFPQDIWEYIHVIGRTSRNDNPGTSHTFFTPQDFFHAKNLINLLESSKQEVPEFLREAEMEGHRNSKPGFGHYSSSNRGFYSDSRRQGPPLRSHQYRDF